MQDLADDFDAFLSRDEADDDEPVQLANEADADKLLRRVRGIERAIAKLDLFVTAEKAQLEAYYLDRSAPLFKARERALRDLEGWLRGQNAMNPKVLSVQLPCGTVQLRKAPDRIVVDGDDAKAQLVAWLEANEMALLVEREEVVKVKAGQLKPLLKPGPLLSKLEDGTEAHKAMHGDEVVPGVQLLVAPERTFGHRTTTLAAVTEPGDNDSNTEPQEEQ